jgi:hypothetical protein
LDVDPGEGGAPGAPGAPQGGTVWDTPPDVARTEGAGSASSAAAQDLWSRQQALRAELAALLERNRTCDALERSSPLDPRPLLL